VRRYEAIRSLFAFPMFSGGNGQTEKRGEELLREKPAYRRGAPIGGFNKLTMTHIFKMMEVDEAMRDVHAHHEGKNRRLLSGETFVAGEHRYVLQCQPIRLAGGV
jgi:hypothetical protein